MLENIAVGKCWRRALGRMLPRSEKSVGEKCCRELL